MSLLSRAGPSSCCRRADLLQLTATQCRAYSAPAGGKTSGWSRPASEKHLEKKEFTRGSRPGFFKPINIGAEVRNRRPILQSTGKAELPHFNPTQVGEPQQMPQRDDGPTRWFGLPRKTLLDFRLLAEPAAVVREVTASTTNTLDSIASNKLSSQDHRFLLTGDAGSGKTYLLLQAVHHCHKHNWIVLYFPRAANMVNSTTPYTYDLNTQTYLQTGYAFETLNRLRRVNEKQLKRLQMQSPLEMERRSLHKGITLLQLVEAGIKEQAIAPAVLRHLLAELGQQEESPVLIAVDDVQALYGKSEYRDPQFRRISSYHLSTPRLLMEYASGKQILKRGAFIGAVSATNPQFPVAPELIEAVGQLPDRPVSAYEKRSPVLSGYAAGLKAIEVPDKLTLKEATGLYELWLRDDGMAPAKSDETFLAKYTESSGNPRAFVWGGLMSSLEASYPDMDSSSHFPQLRLVN